MQSAATEAHCAVELTRVGQGRLRQHDARVLDAGNTLVLTSALGPPRLWGHLLDAALRGFFEGMGRPSDGRVSSRLHQGVDHAQRGARKCVDALLERRAPDIGLLALGRDGPLLHVVCAGPERAYLWRHGELRRLTPREDRSTGLLKAAPTWCVEAVEPGDVVIAGSLSACSDVALKSARDHLNAHVPLARVLTQLNEAAAALAVGCAAVGLTIPKF